MRSALLNDLEYADQPGGDAVLGGQRARLRLLAQLAGDDGEGAPGPLGHGPRVRANRLGNLGCDGAKILDKPAITVE